MAPSAAKSQDGWPGAGELAVAGAFAVEADAAAVRDDAVLLEDDLAVGYPARDLVDRLCRQDERRLGHVLRRFAVGVVDAPDEVVVHGAGGGHDEGGGEAGNGDAVLV